MLNNNVRLAFEMKRRNAHYLRVNITDRVAINNHTTESKQERYEVTYVMNENKDSNNDGMPNLAELNHTNVSSSKDEDEEDSRIVHVPVDRKNTVLLKDAVTKNHMQKLMISIINEDIMERRCRTI